MYVLSHATHTTTRLMIVLALIAIAGSPSHAQTVINSGFNDLTGWTTANDAVLAHPGGTAPWSWNTPVVASLTVNASETVLPTEGTGLGITYAGADSFLQNVLFDIDSSYTFSVDANAIEGTANSQMVDGQFAFVLDGVSSPVNLVPTSAGWERYEWTTLVSAGSHDIGLENTRTAQYAIAYDNFLVAPEGVPEPSSLGIALLILTGLVGKRSRHSV